MVRKWYMDQALHSYRSMNKVLFDLTLEEIEKALELEAASRRRETLIETLMGRAARIVELDYVTKLKERINYGTPT